jgi:RNA polymerase sigma factor (sigma-70 family)
MKRYSRDLRHDEAHSRVRAGVLPAVIDTSEPSQGIAANVSRISANHSAPSDVVMIMRTSNHAGLADDALVAGLAIEDADAATAFVRRFQAKVFGMAISVTHDPLLAEDVAQEAFLRAWRSATTYDGMRGSVSAWLLTITRNAAIDAVRARRSVPADDDALDRLLQASLGDAESRDATGESATTAVEAGRALARLRELPPEQARAVVMAVFGGCTANEVSAHDGIPLGTAKTRIRTGLRRLRTDRADPAVGRPSTAAEDRHG